MGSVDRFKRGAFFGKEFVAGTVSGANNWNGFENNLLFDRVSEKQFADVARAAGCDEIKDSRGVAIADLNADGLLDIAICNNHSEPTIYLNRVPKPGNTAIIRLIGDRTKNRDAIGARVVLHIRHQGTLKTLVRWVEGGTGYAAQSDIRVHFGLGQSSEIESARIYWPDGSRQTLPSDELSKLVNRSTVVRKGSDVIEIQRPFSDEVAISEVTNP